MVSVVRDDRGRRLPAVRSIKLVVANRHVTESLPILSGLFNFY